MLRCLTCALSLLLTLATAGAAQTPATYKFSDTTGAFTFAGLTFSLIHFNPDWASATQNADFKPAPGFPKRSATAFEMQGQFSVRSTRPFQLRQLLTTTDPRTLRYDATLTCPEGIQTNTLALTTSLPVDSFAGQTLRADGLAVKFPEKLDQLGIFNKSAVRKLEFPTPDGSGLITIDGPLSVSIQDDRKFNSENYALRINFDPSTGLIKESKLQLTFHYTQVGPPIDRSVTITAGPDWHPVEQKLEIEKGSVLDFSSLIDAPAGKFGHIVVKGPHFEFANRPNQRVRFYGTNFCFSASYPDKQQAEQIADRLARLGYNSVRIHHYDAGLVDRNANDSTTLDPKQLDKLDYFVHCLKQRGLYINIDLYTIRQTKAHEIPELNKPIYLDGYKALVPLLDSAMVNWQAFAKNLLTHKNPYTGLTWAEDPVLVGICPLNEDPLVGTYVAQPDVRKLYEDRFAQYLKDNNITPANSAERGRIMARWLCELQIAANRKTFAFLKSLGVKAPLTSVNCMDSIGFTPIRNEEEYVDNHAYWDHPSFPERQWSLPHGYSNKSALAAGARVPRTMMPTRIFGKPFTCTEINYCFPNRWRAEGGPLLGAYAALQDWDGIWRFAYSHANANLFNIQAGSGFDLVTQPLDLMSERIAILMFLRGDVQPARQAHTWRVTDKTAYIQPPGWGRGYFPDSFTMLGLRSQIGCQYETDSAPIKSTTITSEDQAAKLAADETVDVQRRRAVSDTGQITLSGDEGTFRVVTDRSECFIMSDSRELTGRAVRISNTAGQCVAFIASMDNKPLPTSSRILVIHLTDMQNTNQRYRNKAMTLMDSWGQLPHLLRAGKATIRLELEGPAAPKAYAIDLSGAHLAPIDLRKDGDSWTLTADTARGVMAYEIVRGQ